MATSPRFLASLVCCGSLIPIYRDFEGSLMAHNLAHPYNRREFLLAHWRHLLTTAGDWLIRCNVGQVVTIDHLPDDVLLAIFDFYVF